MSTNISNWIDPGLPRSALFMFIPRKSVVTPVFFFFFFFPEGVIISAEDNSKTNTE